MQSDAHTSIFYSVQQNVFYCLEQSFHYETEELKTIALSLHKFELKKFCSFGLRMIHVIARKLTLKGIIQCLVILLTRPSDLYKMYAVRY